MIAVAIVLVRYNRHSKYGETNGNQMTDNKVVEPDSSAATGAEVKKARYARMEGNDEESSSESGASIGVELRDYKSKDKSRTKSKTTQQIHMPLRISEEQARVPVVSPEERGQGSQASDDKGKAREDEDRAKDERLE